MLRCIRAAGLSREFRAEAFSGIADVEQGCGAGVREPSKTAPQRTAPILGGSDARTQQHAGIVRASFVRDQARSKRSAFITFVQAATKSFTNFSLLSSWA